MAKTNPRICANCDYWKRYDVDYSDFPEDECGLCKKTGDTVYGDEDACEIFKAGKGQRNRNRNHHK